MESKDFEKLMLHFTDAKTAEELYAVAEEVGELTEDQRKIFETVYETKLKDCLGRADELIKRVRLADKLTPISEYISMSYVASRFFNRSRSWLTNKLNGRASAMTEEEIHKLQEALNTMSKELGEAALRIA